MVAVGLGRRSHVGNGDGTEVTVVSGQKVRGECNRYTSEGRRGQNVRHCAPCESQEVNQILPGCKHNLS